MNSVNTFLDGSFHLHGSLIVNGSCDVYGRIDGDLTVRGQVGEAIIFPSGSLGGSLCATVCEIHGVVSGDVHSRTCSVQPGGSVAGNIASEEADGLQAVNQVKWRYDSDDVYISQQVFELSVSPVIGNLVVGRAVLFADEECSGRSKFSGLMSKVKRFLKK